MSVVGTLAVRIIGDDKDLQSKLGRNIKSVAKWGTVAATAAAAASAAFVRSGVKMGDTLAKTAQKLGVTTEALSKLRFAADQTGVSSQTLDMALQRMTRRIAEAAQGSGEAKDALKELGLNAAELNQIPMDEKMARIADAFNGVGSQADRVRLAMRLFDSEGVALVNTLEGGSAALNEYAQEAERLGLVISSLDAGKIQEAEDAFGKIGRSIDSAAMKLGSKFSPMIVAATDMLDAMVQDAGGMDKVLGDVFDGMVQGIRFALDAVDLLSRGVKLAVAGIEGGFWVLNKIIYETMSGAMEFVRVAYNNIVDGINNLPGINLPKMEVSEFEEGVNATVAMADERLASIGETIKGVFTDPLMGEELIKRTDEVATQMEERINQAKENTGGGMGSLIGMSEADKEKLAGDLEKLREHYASIEEIELEALAKRQETLLAAKEQGMLTEEEYNAMSLESAKEFNDAMEKLERDRGQNTLDQWSGIFGNLASLMSTQSKKLFAIGKAAAIADSIVSTYKGMSKALELGWPMGPIAAAAIGAKGFAQVAAIKNQEIGGAGATASAAGGGAAAVATGDAGAAQPRQTVNIGLQGEVFGRDQVRNLITQINDAIDDGAVLRIA